MGCRSLSFGLLCACLALASWAPAFADDGWGRHPVDAYHRQPLQQHERPVSQDRPTSQDRESQQRQGFGARWPFVSPPANGSFAQPRPNFDNPR